LINSNTKHNGTFLSNLIKLRLSFQLTFAKCPRTAACTK